jgi:aryl-alcohol dehydrogenase-like predicted oxidoreductase
MKYRVLGRSGLKVSMIGVGTGGLDPLGIKSGRSEAEMRDFLRFAFDCGITLFDTAPGYGDGRSERILGSALKELPRDELVVSTKIALASSMPGDPPKVMRPAEVGPAVEGSLRRLQVDYVDVMLMAVADLPEHADTVIEDLMPELVRLKEQGKIRFIGSSEQTRSDGAHMWLQRVLPTEQVDVAMVGHNMINQSAQRTVFPICIEKEIGVLNVFTVRNLFWNPQRLREVIADLKQRGVLAEDTVDDESPLGWLLEDGECGTLVEAAYRYAAYTKGVTTVMCGTIDERELEADVETIQKGPLSADKIERLKLSFGHIAEAIGN